MDQVYQSIIDELNQYLMVTYGESSEDSKVGQKEKTHYHTLNTIQPANLEPKVKEMIALSLGIAVKCDGCIETQVRKLKSLGIRRDELLALLGMAVYIGGGSSVLYAADALKIYSELN